ncbi:hypothetical protein Q5P01_000780 [Channa striata]|uniref:Uncharacterized protein n=1 Tax=Channa striata TaxID=64152 RepID=A0AA88IIB0_CHASR|nr:hypothetical protein Q5P01_000780 [Channa striata]
MLHEIRDFVGLMRAAVSARDDIRALMDRSLERVKRTLLRDSREKDRSRGRQREDGDHAAHGHGRSSDLFHEYETPSGRRRKNGYISRLRELDGPPRPIDGRAWSRSTWAFSPRRRPGPCRPGARSPTMLISLSTKTEHGAAQETRCPRVAGPDIRALQAVSRRDRWFEVRCSERRSF